jgi:hypothetical protein
MGRGIVFATVAIAFVASVQADETRGVECIKRLRAATNSNNVARRRYSPGGRLQVPLQTEFSRVWKSKSNNSRK